MNDKNHQFIFCFTGCSENQFDNNFIMTQIFFSIKLCKSDHHCFLVKCSWQK